MNINVNPVQQNVAIIRLLWEIRKELCVISNGNIFEQNESFQVVGDAVKIIDANIGSNGKLHCDECDYTCDSDKPRALYMHRFHRHKKEKVTV